MESARKEDLARRFARKIDGASHHARYLAVHD